MELPKFEIERRVERGRSLILDKFRWDNYRERTERFISNLDIDIPFKPKGRLAWVSSYNSRCGIASYSGTSL